MSIRLDNQQILPRITRTARRIAPKQQWQLLHIGLVSLDIIMILAAFASAYFLRFGLELPFFQTDVVVSPIRYRNFSLILLVIWVAIFTAFGAYKRRNLLGGVQEYQLLSRACAIGTLSVTVVSFLDTGIVLARGWLVLTWLLSTLFVIFGRFCFRRCIYYLRSRGYFLARTFIIGTNEEGQSIARQLLGWRTSGLDIVGFVADDIDSGVRVYDHLYTVGGLQQLDNLIRHYRVEELVVATSALERSAIVDIFRAYGFDNSVNIRLTSGLYEIMTTGLEVRELAGTPLVRISNAKLRGVDFVLKRMLDIALTIPALVVLSPIFLLIILLIKRDSSGSAIYRRRVIGLNGKEFDAFKFRTMREDGDAILAQHPDLLAELKREHKLKKDPRVTKIGRILRKLSFDELPQLINVLKGEMSLVGPRMITVEELPIYQQWGMNLLTIRPGITGLWQISGRSDISYAERVQIDMQYIRNWTIWLDLQIVVQTIPAMLKGDGAY